MALNYLVYGLEKYGFMIIFLFCIGFFSPDLSPKLGLMFEASFKVTGSSKSNVVKQAFWICTFLFFIWRSFNCYFIYDQRKFNLFIAVLLLFLIALVSFTWSGFASLTLKRSIFQLIFCFSIIAAFYFTLHHNSLEKSLTIAGILILIMTGIAVVKGGGFSSGGALTGFAKGKNLLGQNIIVYMSLVILYLKVSEQYSQRLLILSAIFFVLLLLTQSKTCITLIIFFVLCTYLKALNRYIVPVFFLALCSVFIIMPSLSYYLGSYVHIGDYISPSAITGRGIIWGTLYQDLDFFNKISLGYGYGGYFNTGVTPAMFDDDWSFLNRISSSHNGYLDLLVQFGFTGSMLICAIMVFLYQGIRNYYLVCACLVPIIYNFTEAAFFRDQSVIWLLLLVIFAYSRAAPNAQPEVLEAR